MNLRDKYRALLMAFGQQESDIWSGNLTDNSVNIVTGCLYGSGTFQTGGAFNNYRIYFLQIPKGANSITLTTKGTVIGAGYGRYGFTSDKTSNAEINRPTLIIGATNFQTITTEINKDYPFFVTTANPNYFVTFEFSK